jgi:hypothetical protein
VELVDTLDLGSSAARCESSSLSACTNKKLLLQNRSFFYALNVVDVRRGEKFTPSLVAGILLDCTKPVVKQRAFLAFARILAQSQL